VTPGDFGIALAEESRSLTLPRKPIPPHVESAVSFDGWSPCEPDRAMDPTSSSRRSSGVASRHHHSGGMPMSPHSTFLTTLAALASLAAPAAAQQDTGMMAHDSAMMDSGGPMDHGAAMGDKMGGDKMMDHDSTGGMAMHDGPMFMGASGEQAAGDYEVVDVDGRHQLELSDEFAVADGRDLYLVLANGDAADDGSLSLGKLKQRNGAQVYDLPKGKDLSGYTTLLVWSKKDKRAVATAEWRSEGGGSMEHM
jgi:hypothetical protein